MKFLIFLIFVLNLFAFSSCQKNQKSRHGAWKNRNLTPEDENNFREWQQKHKKTYNSPIEELEAMKKMATNKEQIDAHNKLFDQGLVTFRRGLWEHSDLAPEDKEKMLQGLEIPATIRSLPMSPNPPQFPVGPPSVDWKAKGLVAPVESQGQ